MRRYVVEKKDGGFVLPLEGFVASAWDEVGGWLVVRDGVSADEARIELDPEKHGRVAARLAATGARVHRVFVRADGTLVAEIGAASLEMPPSEDVEAWEVRGPGDVLVIATPGGGEPSIWDASSESFTLRAGEPMPPKINKALEKLYRVFEKGEDE